MTFCEREPAAIIVSEAKDLSARDMHRSFAANSAAQDEKGLS
jgi:hypothetical protein